MQLGLNPDRTVEVPPLSRVREAGWYRGSSAPGDPGPSVILGHVDSAQYGKGIFYRLGTLRPGDRVLIYRADREVALYSVTSVVQVAKSDFPTQKVYGRTKNAQIRLITCGGAFDNVHKSYLDNIIAYGELLSVAQQ